MRIFIHQKAGEDYPEKYKGDAKFLQESKNTIIRLLGLRKEDKVEFIEEPNIHLDRSDLRYDFACLYTDGVIDSKEVFGEHYTCKFDISPYGEDFEVAVIPMTFPSYKWDNVQVCISQHPALFMAAHLRIGDKKVLTIRTGSGGVKDLWAMVNPIAKALELGVDLTEILTDNAFKNVVKLIDIGRIAIYSYDNKGKPVKVRGE